MNEIDMILEILREAKKPLTALEISKYIYNNFEGYILDKRDINKLIHSEIYDLVVRDPTNSTYTIFSKQNYFQKPKNVKAQILEDILQCVESFSFMSQLTLNNIHSTLRNYLNKSYTIQEVREIYNKNDLLIFEYFNDFQIKKDNINKEIKRKHFELNSNFDDRKSLNLNTTNIIDIHFEALSWFATNRNQTLGYFQIRGQKTFNNGSLFIFNSAKGIHKPKLLKYALSIKILHESPYADKITKTSNGWNLVYHKETGNEWTNDALKNCLKDSIPIGVFLQDETSSRSRYKSSSYNVLGLGYVEAFDGDRFYISEIPEILYDKFNKNKIFSKGESTFDLLKLVISKENVFNKFTIQEKNQIISLLEAEEYFQSASLFANFCNKYGLVEMKQINKWFNELD